MEEYLFTKKIRYLFKEVKYTPDDFTMLFWNRESKQTLNSRKKAVIGNWEQIGIKNNPHKFEFEKYDIAKEQVAGKLAFTKESFLIDSLEEFEERVDIYIKNIKYSKNEFEFDYAYIYYFDIVTKEMNYLKIELLKYSNDNIKIKLTPPDIYEDAEPYYGILETIPDYYHMMVKNDFEIISFYFAINKGFSNKKMLYGLRMGLDYDKRLPISAKNVLTKEILNSSQQDEIYMNLNESEYLLLEELHLNRRYTIKINFMKKIQQNIKNLTIFTKKIRKKFKDKVFDDIYFNIFYQSFLSLNKIAQKVLQGKNYFVASRERATNIFLTMISKEENAYCNIVHPLFKSHSSMFDEKSSIENKEDVELNIGLAKSGLKITRILVLDRQYKITDYFIAIVEKMIESGIDIRIVQKEDIENFIVSYDFIYNKVIGVAGYRNIEERKCYFKISKEPDKIKNLANDFLKIKNKSYSFQEFLDKPKHQNNKILNQLLGEWNWYFYSSMQENEKVEIWNFTLKIESSGEVYFYNKKYKDLNFKGIVDTTYSSNQSFIKASAKKSNNLTLIFIENRDIHKEVFKVSLLDKQRGIHRNMASFGIFSKVVLLESEIIKALGEDVKETRFMEKEGFDKRINDLDMKIRKKKADKS